MSLRRRALATLGGVGLAVFTLFRARAANPALEGPPPIADEAGPVTREIPTGAFVAEDEAALTRAPAEGPDAI